MAFVSKDAVERFTRWAEEDIEVLTAELAAARKIARLGKRHAEAVALSDRWDAWMSCPLCQPWRGGHQGATAHTCELDREGRRQMANLDITKHGNKTDELASQVGEAYEAWCKERR
jgi:hypothetical protein